MSQFDLLPTNTGPGSYNPQYQRDIQNSEKKHHMNSTFVSKV